MLSLLFSYNIILGNGNMNIRQHSLAARLVAGLIATYMAYDKVPWDDSKEGIERVTEIRKFLLSDASSVVRSKTQKDVRVVWNGAPSAPFKGGTCC
jgi:hypothetical protein